MNLHPGAAVALERLSADELGIARLMARGDLVSPQHYKNLTLFSVRVTGTGVSIRPSLDEFVYRRPEDYLTPDFLARIGGLPLIWKHPRKNLLDSKEYNERVVGAVMLPFIRGDEVWAICRVHDDDAIAALSEEQWSTSPAVLLDKKTKLKMENGDHLLLEEKPALVDHLAICEKGVWDKEGPPTGVETAEATIRGDSTMAAETEIEKKAREDSAAKADATRADAENKMNEKMDAALKGIADATACMKDVMKRQDAIEVREKEREKERDDRAKKDAARKDDDDDDKKKDAKKDAEGDKPAFLEKDKRKDAEGETPEEKEKAELLAADKKRKDARGRRDDDDDDDKRRDKRKDDDDDKRRDARADASGLTAMQQRLAEQDKVIKDLIARTPRDPSDAEFSKMAEIQARADEAYVANGIGRAPRFLSGETPIAYRRRLLDGLKKFSGRHKDANLLLVGDEVTFKNVEDQVYADSIDAAKTPTGIPFGELRCVSKVMPSGHRVNEFYGQPSAWMDEIAGPTRQFVRKFNTDQRSA